jgi:hypothetical protein
MRERIPNEGPCQIGRGIHNAPRIAYEAGLNRRTITAPVTKRRRDWFRILRHLMAAGIGLADVARACNRDAGAVKHWQNEGDPKESDARIVLALYAKFCPVEFEEHQREFNIRVAVRPSQEG